MVAGLLATAAWFLLAESGNKGAEDFIATGILALAAIGLVWSDLARRRDRPVLCVKGRAIGVYRARRLAGVVGPGSLILTELNGLTTFKILTPLILLAFVGFVAGCAGAYPSVRERAALLTGSAFLGGVAVSIGLVRLAWLHVLILLPDHREVFMLLDWDRDDLQALMKE